MVKIFIISLPRTGTTSACVYLLNQGFKVAHIAFSDVVIDRADVIADTPVFIDYPKLLECYPDAKFIFLERPFESWVLSIRRLLKSMRKQWLRDKSLFEPEIRRCFTEAFPSFYKLTEFSDNYLLDCYVKHKEAVGSTFESNPNQVLYVDISKKGAVESLKRFCLGGVALVGENSEEDEFPHVNKGRRITYWEDVAHPNKIDSKL